MQERHRIGLAAVIALGAAVATLVRCAGEGHSGVLFTVAGAAGIALGAAATLRGWTWGALLSAACGAGFAAAPFLGIAPPWFVLVATAATLPLFAAARPLARVDTAATLAAVALVTALGLAAAFTVREIGFDLLDTVLLSLGP